MASGKNKAQIDDDLLVTEFKLLATRIPNMRLISDMTSLSDEATIQTIVEGTEKNITEKKEAAPTFMEALHHQITDTFCKQASDIEFQPNAEYIIDKNKFIVRMTLIDEAVQIVVSQPLWMPLPHNLHYRVMAHPLEQRKMYGPLWHEKYWSHVASGVYTTASTCSAREQYQSEARLKDSYNCYPQAAHLKLFL